METPSGACGAREVLVDGPYCLVLAQAIPSSRGPKMGDGLTEAPIRSADRPLTGPAFTNVPGERAGMDSLFGLGNA